MTAWGVLILALAALRRNKVRSGLTMLGIAIGVVAVISMGALGRGATVMIQSQIGSAGRNLLLVLPEAVSVRGLMTGAGSSTTLTPADVEAVRREVPTVRLITPMIRARQQLVAGSRNWVPLAILGTSTDFLEIREWPVDEGSPFTALDVASSARVCVIGRRVAAELFPDGGAVGETLRIRNMPFRVNGVLGAKGVNPMGVDQDDIIVAPWTTTRSLLQGSAFACIDQMLVSAVSEAGVPEAAESIAALLRQRHGLAPDHADDFMVITMAEMSAVLTRTAGFMTTFLAVVASISLIVGGVGIMNVMLVSVLQRTGEIGLRMSVGARRRDILVQFLVESGVLSVAAGLMGTLLGVLAAEILSRALHWPIAVTAPSVAISFGCSAAVGIFFGLYPALRAARLDPVEALRHE